MLTFRSQGDKWRKALLFVNFLPSQNGLRISPNAQVSETFWYENPLFTFNLQTKGSARAPIRPGNGLLGITVFFRGWWGPTGWYHAHKKVVSHSSGWFIHSSRKVVQHRRMTNIWGDWVSLDIDSPVTNCKRFKKNLSVSVQIQIRDEIEHKNKRGVWIEFVIKKPFSILTA